MPKSSKKKKNLYPVNYLPSIFSILYNAVGKLIKFIASSNTLFKKKRTSVTLIDAVLILKCVTFYQNIKASYQIEFLWLPIQ